MWHTACIMRMHATNALGVRSYNRAHRAQKREGLVSIEKIKAKQTLGIELTEQEQAMLASEQGVPAVSGLSSVPESLKPVQTELPINGSEYDVFVAKYKPTAGQSKRIGSVKATKEENTKLREAHADEKERASARSALVKQKKENLRLYYARKAYNRTRVEFRQSHVRPFVGVLFTGDSSNGLSARREDWEFILSPEGLKMIQDGIKTLEKTPADYFENYRAYNQAFKLKLNK